MLYLECPECGEDRDSRIESLDDDCTFCHTCRGYFDPLAEGDYAEAEAAHGDLVAAFGDPRDARRASSLCEGWQIG